MPRAIIRKTLTTATVVAATAAITSTVVSQHFEDAADQANQMMQAWMRLGQPGPEHKAMADLVGTWDHEQTHWMYPGAEPSHANSTAEVESIFGGRYLIERLSGTMEHEGQEFQWEGMGLFGFDRLEEEHFFVWIDSMSTMAIVARGNADATGNVVTYHSTMTNPVTREPMKVRTVQTRNADGTVLLEMYELLGTDTWFKNMELRSTRR